MTLVPRFCIRLTLALGFVALVGLAAFNQSASAQTSGSKPDPYRRYYMIVRAPDGGMICREATEQEAKAQLKRSASGRVLEQINHLPNKSGPSTAVDDGSLPGLKIFLHAEPQLNNFPAAKAAFIRAAAAWEAIIKTPMTVHLEVDYGPTGFGIPWDDENVIGATGTIAVPRPYTSVRNNLIVSASNGSESSLYSLLPATSVPTDAGNAGTMAVNVSLARAIGLIDANADVADYRQQIAFNSAFDFDTDSSNGITTGQMDFEAVATHEIGHALGFDSSNGEGGTPPRVSVWDLFRFRPGVTNFTTNNRIMTIGGGLQVYYAGGAELGLATGGPDPGPGDGDGDQSSHWRDNNSSNFGTAIGIMDPNIALGVHEFIKAPDISALNFMGYNMEANTTPPPPPPPPAAPANDNFASAQVISGCASPTGGIIGTNISATKEAGEPSHSPNNDPLGRSVWYQWQAPSTGSVTFTTANSNYDTLLAVYTGNSVNSLTLLGRNDDATNVLTSSVTFNATAGTTYRIAVDGYNNNNSGGDSGDIVLNWTASNCNVTPPTCTYSISPSSLHFNAGGGSGVTVNVTAGSGCAWTAQSNNTSFITITNGTSGTGSGTVTYSVAANTTTSSRSGTMTIAGQTFTVTQDAAVGCSNSFSITPTSLVFNAGGGSGSTVNVTGGAGCGWTAVSNNSFITITSGATGSGNGTVTYSVAPNPSTSQRTGTMTIAGQTFTVTQDAGAGCSYSISPSSLNFNPGGGPGSTVSVTAGAGCAWTAVSNDSFITITGGASGTGNGTVTYSVAANPSIQRTGTMTIAGQTFTVTQDAGASCSYSISPTSLNFAAGGGFGATVQVTTGITCAWTAVSNNPSFITITNGASGTGTASVTYAVAPNSGPARAGTMTIAGQTYTVTQNSATPSASTLQLAQSSYNVNESTGSISILVNRSGDLSAPVSVNYATSDASNFLQNCNVVNGQATSRCDYISLVGTLHFASGENSKTLSVPVVDDTYLENAETFFLSLSNATNGAVIGANQTATISITDNGNDGLGLSNPIDSTNFFVRQHYMDFLGREPDPASIGWNNQINNCVPSQPSCDRLSVSQGIYNSPEFKDRGYFIYKFYSAAFGRKPTYDEFVLDRARVSGFQTEAELEQSKLDFIADFMSRPEFAVYGGLTNDQYVQTLYNLAGVTQVTVNGPVYTVEWMQQSMRTGKTRAQVLREVAESPEVSARFLTESTIVMHYFGYLRRDPDGAYQAWINIFNQTGDSRNVTNGFVNSQEYRNRFSQ